MKDIEVEELVIFAFVPGFIGARLWYVLTEWKSYENNPVEALYIWNGGLGIYGAALGVMLGILVYSYFRKKNFLKIIDIMALFLPLGQIIGRYGNFFNQELFGPPTSMPWGMFIRPENRPGEYASSQFFHPAFLYEQIGNAILMIINYFLYKKYKLNYNLYLGTWLTGYGIIRFVVEFFRIGSKEYFGLSDNQIASLFLAALGIIYLVVKFLKIKKDVKEEI